MMNHAKLQETIAGLAQEIDAITDEKIKSIQKTLLNVIELLFADNETLRKENQQLRDDNNRLKGEQGRPSIRKQSQNNHSSEKDRKPRGQQSKKKKAKKKETLVIHRVEICDLDHALLPADATNPSRFKILLFVQKILALKRKFTTLPH